MAYDTNQNTVKIQIRRGLALNRPMLSVGEMWLDTDTGAVWIGTASGNVAIDATQIVTAFQITPDNVHVPSEKLVKDSLDNKVNTSSTTATPTLGKIPIADGSAKLDGWVTPYSLPVVTSFQVTPDNTHVASEKLTKDQLNLKVDTANAGISVTEVSPSNKLVDDASMFKTPAGVLLNDATLMFSHPQSYVIQLSGASRTLSCVTNGTPTVTTASTNGLTIGMAVTGNTIQASSAILSITNDTTFTLDKSSSGSGTNNLAFVNLNNESAMFVWKFPQTQYTPKTINSLVFGGGGSSFLRIYAGIYDTTGALLRQTAARAGYSTAPFSIALTTPLTLTMGWYYCAVQGSGTSAISLIAQLLPRATAVYLNGSADLYGNAGTIFAGLATGQPVYATGLPANMGIILPYSTDTAYPTGYAV